MTQLAKAPLGRLVRVNLRDAWEHEALQFTPWLAQTENISLLGDAIHLDLEVQSSEAPVGPCSADILCKDTLTGHYVLIENQLERTDHSHLGQLLTYAAGLDAVTIVWIAARFTDEHRAALDWLNRSTAEGLNFFGLELEVWKIGDSPLAPKFNVVSQPNDWVKTVKQQADVSAASALTAFQKLHLEYWTRFQSFLEERQSPVRTSKPSKESWVEVALGRSYFTLVAANSMRDNQTWVYLRIYGPAAKQQFSTMEQTYGEAINAMAPGKVEWRALPTNKESQLRLTRPSEPSNQATWPELMSWMAETLERWSQTLRPIVKALPEGAPVQAEPSLTADIEEPELEPDA